MPIAHAETDQPEEKSPLLGLGLSVASTALPLAAIGALWQSGNAEEHLGLWSAPRGAPMEPIASADRPHAGRNRFHAGVRHGRGRHVLISPR